MKTCLIRGSFKKFYLLGHKFCSDKDISLKISITIAHNVTYMWCKYKANTISRFLFVTLKTTVRFGTPETVKICTTFTKAAQVQ